MPTKKQYKENKDEIRAYQESWKEDNKEKWAGYQTTYRQNNKEKVNEKQREYNANYPERKAAHSIVNRALKAGKLTKQPCATCGSTVNLEAHHHNYFLPLSVQWMCKKHHKAVHKLTEETRDFT